MMHTHRKRSPSYTNRPVTTGNGNIISKNNEINTESSTHQQNDSKDTKLRADLQQQKNHKEIAKNSVEASSTKTQCEASEQITNESAFSTILVEGGENENYEQSETGTINDKERRLKTNTFKNNGFENDNIEINENKPLDLFDISSQNATHVKTFMQDCEEKVSSVGLDNIKHEPSTKSVDFNGSDEKYESLQHIKAESHKDGTGANKLVSHLEVNKENKIVNSEAHEELNKDSEEDEMKTNSLQINKGVQKGQQINFFLNSQPDAQNEHPVPIKEKTITLEETREVQQTKQNVTDDLLNIKDIIREKHPDLICKNTDTKITMETCEIDLENKQKDIHIKSNDLMLKEITSKELDEKNIGTNANDMEKINDFSLTIRSSNETHLKEDVINKKPVEAINSHETLSNNLEVKGFNINNYNSRIIPVEQSKTNEKISSRHLSNTTSQILYDMHGVSESKFDEADVVNEKINSNPLENHATDKPQMDFSEKIDLVTKENTEVTSNKLSASNIKQKSNDVVNEKINSNTTENHATDKSQMDFSEKINFQTKENTEVNEKINSNPLESHATDKPQMDFSEKIDLVTKENIEVSSSKLSATYKRISNDVMNEKINSNTTENHATDLVTKENIEVPSNKLSATKSNDVVNEKNNSNPLENHATDKPQMDFSEKIDLVTKENIEVPSSELSATFIKQKSNDVVNEKINSNPLENHATDKSQMDCSEKNNFQTKDNTEVNQKINSNPLENRATDKPQMDFSEKIDLVSKENIEVPSSKLSATYINQKSNDVVNEKNNSNPLENHATDKYQMDCLEKINFQTKENTEVNEKINSNPLENHATNKPQMDFSERIGLATKENIEVPSSKLSATYIKQKSNDVNEKINSNSLENRATDKTQIDFVTKEITDVPSNKVSATNIKQKSNDKISALDENVCDIKKNKQTPDEVIVEDINKLLEKTIEECLDNDFNEDKKFDTKFDPNLTNFSQTEYSESRFNKSLQNNKLIEASQQINEKDEFDIKEHKSQKCEEVRENDGLNKDGDIKQNLVLEPTQMNSDNLKNNNQELQTKEKVNLYKNDGNTVNNKTNVLNSPESISSERVNIYSTDLKNLNSTDETVIGTSDNKFIEKTKDVTETNKICQADQQYNTEATNQKKSEEPLQTCQEINSIVIQKSFGQAGEIQDNESDNSLIDRNEINLNNHNLKGIIDQKICTAEVHKIQQNIETTACSSNQTAPKRTIQRQKNIPEQYTSNETLENYMGELSYSTNKKPNIGTILEDASNIIDNRVTETGNLKSKSLQHQLEESMIASEDNVIKNVDKPATITTKTQYNKQDLISDNNKSPQAQEQLMLSLKLKPNFIDNNNPLSDSTETTESEVVISNLRENTVGMLNNSEVLGSTQHVADKNNHDLDENETTDGENITKQEKLEKIATRIGFAENLTTKENAKEAIQKSDLPHLDNGKNITKQENLDKIATIDGIAENLTTKENANGGNEKPELQHLNIAKQEKLKKIVTRNGVAENLITKENANGGNEKLGLQVLGNGNNITKQENLEKIATIDGIAENLTTKENASGGNEKSELQNLDNAKNIAKQEKLEKIATIDVIAQNLTTKENAKEAIQKSDLPHLDNGKNITKQENLEKIATIDGIAKNLTTKENAIGGNAKPELQFLDNSKNIANQENLEKIATIDGTAKNLTSKENASGGNEKLELVFLDNGKNITKQENFEKIATRNGIAENLTTKENVNEAIQKSELPHLDNGKNITKHENLEKIATVDGIAEYLTTKESANGGNGKPELQFLDNAKNIAKQEKLEKIATIDGNAENLTTKENASGGNEKLELVFLDNGKNITKQENFEKIATRNGIAENLTTKENANEANQKSELPHLDTGKNITKQEKLEKIATRNGVAENLTTKENASGGNEKSELQFLDNAKNITKHEKLEKMATRNGVAENLTTKQNANEAIQRSELPHLDNGKNTTKQNLEKIATIDGTAENLTTKENTSGGKENSELQHLDNAKNTVKEEKLEKIATIDGIAENLTPKENASRGNEKSELQFLDNGKNITKENLEKIATIDGIAENLTTKENASGGNEKPELQLLDNAKNITKHENLEKIATIDGIAENLTTKENASGGNEKELQLLDNAKNITKHENLEKIATIDGIAENLTTKENASGGNEKSELQFLDNGKNITKENLEKIVTIDRIAENLTTKENANGENEKPELQHLNNAKIIAKQEKLETIVTRNGVAENFTTENANEAIQKSELPHLDNEKNITKQENLEKMATIDGIAENLSTKENASGGNEKPELQHLDNAKNIAKQEKLVKITTINGVAEDLTTKEYANEATKKSELQYSDNGRNIAKQATLARISTIDGVAKKFTSKENISEENQILQLQNEEHKINSFKNEYNQHHKSDSANATALQNNLKPLNNKNDLHASFNLQDGKSQNERPIKQGTPKNQIEKNVLVSDNKKKIKIDSEEINEKLLDEHKVVRSSMVELNNGEFNSGELRGDYEQVRNIAIPERKQFVDHQTNENKQQLMNRNDSIDLIANKNKMLNRIATTSTSHKTQNSNITNITTNNVIDMTSTQKMENKANITSVECREQENVEKQNENKIKSSTEHKNIDMKKSFFDKYYDEETAVEDTSNPNINNNNEHHVFLATKEAETKHSHPNALNFQQNEALNLKYTDDGVSKASLIQLSTSEIGGNTNNEETTENVNIKTAETKIGKESLLVNRIRNFNECLNTSISAQCFAETCLRSFWKEYKMNNSLPLSQYNYIENEPQQQKAQQRNFITESKNTNKEQFMAKMEEEALAQTISASYKNHKISCPQNDTILQKQKEVERTASIFYTVPDKEKRNIYKKPSSFVILIDESKQASGRTNSTPNIEKEIQKYKTNNLVKLKFLGCVDANQGMDINKSEYDTANLVVHTTNHEPNITDEYLIISEPLLQKIIKLSETKTPKITDWPESANDEMLVSLEKIGNLVSTKCKIGSNDYHTLVSDELLDSFDENSWNSEIVTDNLGSLNSSVSTEANINIENEVLPPKEHGKSNDTELETTANTPKILDNCENNQVTINMENSESETNSTETKREYMKAKHSDLNEYIYFQSLTSANNNIKDQSARIIQNLFKDFLKQKSISTTNNIEIRKSNWFIGHEAIVVSKQLNQTKSEVPFEETKTFSKLIASPNSSLGNMVANNSNKNHSTSVSNNSTNTVVVGNDHTINISKDIITAIAEDQMNNKKDIELGDHCGLFLKDNEEIIPTENSGTSSVSDLDDTDNSLSTRTVKLHKPDMIITKMQQKRENTTKLLLLGKSKDYSFEEPLIPAINSLDTDEEGIVICKLQRESIRQNSSNSDDTNIIIGFYKEDDTNSLYNFDINKDSPAKDDTKLPLKNVTIDESIKYIEPSDYEVNSDKD